MNNFIEENWKKILITIFLLIILKVLWILIVMAPDYQFSRVKELTNIIMWPVVVLFGALFFNRVFTYLFFSVRKFNFFGMEGELRGIEDVINEQVENRLREKKDEEKKEKLFKELKINAEQEVILGKAFDYDKKRLADLEQENTELKKYLNSQRNEKIHGCSLENLSACDNAGLMKLIAALLAREGKKSK